MSHTPGPWGFEDRDNKHMVTAGKDRRGRFRYICDPSYGPRSSERSNARLIAAAPDLFFALKEFVGEECHCEESHGLCVQCIGRAAIAKAAPTGRSK